MSDRSTCDAVARRVAEERDKAKQIAAELAPLRATIDDADIRKFFPELPARLRGQRWCNRPLGVSLSHFLLVAPPAFFHVQPLTEQEFERRYRMPVKVVEELADLGFVIPSVYHRNPADWKGTEYEYLEGLVKKSYVNGERVDAYLRLKEPRFPDYVEMRREQLRRILSDPKVQVLAPAADDLTESRDSLARSYGRDWAYLDAVRPLASRFVGDVLAAGETAKGIDYLHIFTLLSFGPISGALGGEFFWGPESVARWRAVDDGVLNLSELEFSGGLG